MTRLLPPTAMRLDAVRRKRCALQLLGLEVGDVRINRERPHLILLESVPTACFPCPVAFIDRVLPERRL